MSALRTAIQRLEDPGNDSVMEPDSSTKNMMLGTTRRAPTFTDAQAGIEGGTTMRTFLVNATVESL